MNDSGVIFVVVEIDFMWVSCYVVYIIVFFYGFLKLVFINLVEVKSELMN